MSSHRTQESCRQLYNICTSGHAGCGGACSLRPRLSTVITGAHVTARTETVEQARGTQNGVTHVQRTRPRKLSERHLPALGQAAVPVSTVPNGPQGFSVQNRIKTKGRARLKAENLEVLMRIRTEGPAILNFDFYRALQKFRAAKHRRICQGRCFDTPFSFKKMDPD
ncbi:hypothetical protein Bbelb_316860 [Branchiostoma belcheri]|nr:hypothetical protein Bbelb_316860 [Branchiostoma belcheri]